MYSLISVDHKEVTKAKRVNKKIKSINTIIYKVSKSCFFSSILNGVARTLSFFKKQLKSKKANKSNVRNNFYLGFIYFQCLTLSFFKQIIKTTKN